MGVELIKGSTSAPSIAVDRQSAGKHGYTSVEQLSSGVHSKVFKEACIPANAASVLIKIVDIQKTSAYPDAVLHELQKMEFLSHPNVLRPHCSLSADGQFCILMPWVSWGCLQSIVDGSFPDGLSEKCIATILKEILNALVYLHGEGHVHKDITLGNIFIAPNGVVKLAYFGISSSLFNPSTSASSNSLDSMAIDVSGNPYWISPEMIKSPTLYTTMADIWSFGVVAMELANGTCPVSEIPESDSLKLKILKRLPFYKHYKKVPDGKSNDLSKDFKEMVGWCLDQDPDKRPSAEELLLHPFFKKSEGHDFLIKELQQLHQLKATGVEEETNERMASGWEFDQEIFQLVPVLDDFDIEECGIIIPERCKTEWVIKGY